MDAQEEHPAEEVKRLRRCVNDLISMMALPALWSGGDPSHIARTLIDVLQRLLHLDLIYVKLDDSTGEAPIEEMVRDAQTAAQVSDPKEIGAELLQLLGDDAQKWPTRTLYQLGNREFWIVPLRLGLGAELDMLVAGAERSDFPDQTEELLLRTAANHAAMALHEARLRNEQKRLAAEERLRESELNLRQLTETIPEMLWSATPDGAFDYCNARLLDYTGFAAQEMMGNKWTKLIHPDDVEPTVRAWMSCMTSGAQFQVEVRIIHASDQMYRWCVANALPLVDRDGRILKWHGTVVDMHDWKQAQETLRNTQAELANLTRVMTMGQLTASIAHEVNQPLSGIITNASTCLRMLDADPPNIEGARETARRTIRDGNRASEIITRLRALFSNRQTTTESVDLNEAAKEVTALLLSKLQKDGVTLRCELADDLPLVAGDRVQLQQVIMNLLQNGSDAMAGVQDRSRQLLIQTQRDETDHVCLTVQDNGIGLDPRAANRLFDVFYTTKNDGMGVGLAVSRSIIENHRGRLWVEPNKGPGTTFSFSIPRGARLASQVSSARKPAASDPRVVARDF
jgi:PAS domain S-box-containing protein